MTVKEGWMYHTPESTGLPWATDPTMTILYKFGYIPADNESIINKSDKIDASRIKQVGSYNSTIHMGNKPNGDISMNHGMINGLPLYWMLGDVSESSGVYTISTMDGSSRKPRLGIRQEIDTKNYHTYGLTMSRLNLSYNNNMLWANHSWMGMKSELDAVPLTPSYNYPSDVGNAYNVLTDMTWNSIALKPITFKTEMNQMLSPFMGEDGYYVEISEFSPIDVLHAVQFLDNESDNAGMIEDFDNKTERSFSWTVKKAQDPTNYITCNGSGYLIDQNISKGYGIQTHYTYAIWCSALTFTVVDGLNKTIFYGIE